MPKPLPPAVPSALNPPPSAAYPYRFFEAVADHPFQFADSGSSPRNAWWLMDAAFLAYSSPADIRHAYDDPALHATVATFSGLTTQCYVASTDDWVVLAFRGTQVDDFGSSVIDWTVDARFLPVPDAHGHLVHAGFLDAVRDVWQDVSAHLLALQRARARPLWITGHSLGAALATLAANLCADLPALSLVGLCTYGSPRVGDLAFGRGIAAPVWRFRHNADIVTRLPIGLVFRHVGRLLFIDSRGEVHEDPADDAVDLPLARSNIALLAQRARQHAQDLRIGPLTVVPEFLADHAPINYAIRLWNAYEASLGSREGGLAES